MWYVFTHLLAEGTIIYSFWLQFLWEQVTEACFRKVHRCLHKALASTWDRTIQWKYWIYAKHFSIMGCSVSTNQCQQARELGYFYGRLLRPTSNGSSHQAYDRWWCACQCNSPPELHYCFEKINMKRAFEILKSLPRGSCFLIRVHDEPARQAAERCGRGRRREHGHEHGSGSGRGG